MGGESLFKLFHVGVLFVQGIQQKLTCSAIVGTGLDDSLHGVVEIVKHIVENEVTIKVVVRAALPDSFFDVVSKLLGCVLADFHRVKLKWC
jgi:hypothetical protein